MTGVICPWGKCRVGGGGVICTGGRVLSPLRFTCNTGCTHCATKTFYGMYFVQTERTIEIQQVRPTEVCGKV